MNIDDWVVIKFLFLPYLADIYEAIYSFEASEPCDLSFNVGERIIVLKYDGDWWTGQIGDRTGLFPNNYVQKIDRTQETAIATTSYQTTEKDHLSFESDQIISILNKDDKGWYQGKIRVYIVFCLSFEVVSR